MEAKLKKKDYQRKIKICDAEFKKIRQGGLQNLYTFCVHSKLLKRHGVK